MNIDTDPYHQHKIGIKEIIRNDNTIDAINKKYISTLAGYAGHEKTLDGAKKRLEYIIKIMEKYEREIKLQDSGTSNVGFDLS